jgi:SWI/SNF-related matrix-associated actin-dependent regulator 1 of chromatin subfamily A
MLDRLPGYLIEPPPADHYYGTVAFNAEKGQWVISAEPAVLEMAKRVFPGCSVASRKEKGVVTFPATRRAVGDLNWLMLRFPLQVLHPDRFRAGRELAIEHAARRARNQVVEAVATPASFLGQLYPYQAEDVAFLIKNERALLANEMGLGKTVEALAAIATARPFPVLVVAPANIQRQWAAKAKEFLRFPQGKAGLTHIIKGRTPYDLPEVQIYVIHYGLLADWRQTLEDVGFGAVVFDEIQELRRVQSYKYAAASSIASGVRYVWGLSGTPIYNYGEEIWAVLNIMDYHCLGDFDSFTREWCAPLRNHWAVEKPEVLGDYLRREGLMLRRRKKDVQKQLPPKHRAITQVGYDEDRYAELIAQAVAVAKSYNRIRDWKARGEAATEMARESRRACGVAKARHVAAFTATLLEAGEKVLLYAYHHEVQDVLAEELARFQPVRISGRESPRQKDEAVKAFCAGKTNLIQLSLRSTAGLDGLQGRGTCVVFAELDWSPAVHSQCEDRLHRVGVHADLTELLCYYLVMTRAQSYDSIILEALGLKVGQFVGIMGDTWETEADRALQQRAAENHLRRVVDMLQAEAA